MFAEHDHPDAAEQTKKSEATKRYVLDTIFVRRRRAHMARSATAGRGDRESEAEAYEPEGFWNEYGDHNQRQEQGGARSDISARFAGAAGGVEVLRDMLVRIG